jgi:hypothetical protein
MRTRVLVNRNGKGENSTCEINARDRASCHYRPASRRKTHRIHRNRMRVAVRNRMQVTSFPRNPHHFSIMLACRHAKRSRRHLRNFLPPLQRDGKLYNFSSCLLCAHSKEFKIQKVVPEIYVASFGTEELCKKNKKKVFSELGFRGTFLFLDVLLWPNRCLCHR